MSAEKTAAEKISERSQQIAATGGFQVFGVDGDGGAWYSENSRPRTSGHIVARHPMTVAEAEAAIELQIFRNQSGRPNADKWDMRDAKAATGTK